MLANRAARGLASLRVQNNEMTLDEAGKFHAGWTPRGWSDATSKLVGFEQLLYLRQPGYGPSYVVGKAQLDKMIARASHHMDSQGATITVALAGANFTAGRGRAREGGRAPELGISGGGEAPASQSREAGNSVLGKPSEASGKPFSLQQTFAAIWASGIVPPSIIDSEFLERLP